MSARLRLPLPGKPCLPLLLVVAVAALLVVETPLRAAAAPGSAAPLSGAPGGAAGLGEALGPSTSSQIALAEHLRRQGVVFYGAFWCQHCFDQKLLFGQQAGDRLPYVECARDEADTRRCEAAGVVAYPTWMMGGREPLIGVQTLQRLAAWSGYSGPAEFPAGRLGR